MVEMEAQEAIMTLIKTPQQGGPWKNGILLSISYVSRHLEPDGHRYA